MRHARRSAPAALFALLAAGSVGFVACGGAGESPSTSTSASSGATTTQAGAGGAGGSAGSEGGGGSALPVAPMRKTVSGDLTWSVTFDDTATMAGASACSYTRHYEGVEDRSAPWFCPSCEVVFRADVKMTAGLEECFAAQVSDTTPAKVEWIGYEPNGTFRRGVGTTMSEQGTESPVDGGFSMKNSVSDLDAKAGGKMAFEVTGSFTVGEAEGDVMNGFVPPATYACGWPKADPAPYAGDYVLAKGATMPDGLFKDACDETVRLHDLAGAYLFVEMSARNCGPCQQMAKEAEAFVADMKAKNIEVRMVTLLCPSLEDTIGTTTIPMLAAWTKKYLLTSPVLADRGWGLGMFEPALGADNVGYPSWAIVDPQLKVIDIGSGFGGFTEIAATIEADAAL